MPKRRRNESQRHDTKWERMLDQWRRISLGERRRRKKGLLKSKPSPNTLQAERHPPYCPSGEDSPYHPRERTHHTVLVRELISMPQAYPNFLDFSRGFASKNTRDGMIHKIQRITILNIYKGTPQNIG
jgi:hypothetical protein